MTTRILKTIGNINGIPTSFQEVEYLEADGNQWLDLGLYGNLNTEIEVGAYVGEHTVHYALVGDFTDSTKAITLPINYGTSGLYSRFGNKSITTGLGSETGTYKFVINKTGYYRDGTLLGSFNATTAFTTTNTMMLFGFTNLGRNYFEGKVYYCKIYDNDTLVGDFVPCLDSTGKPCMFDKINKRVCYNLNTGADFTYGRKIIPVEYLQSSDTQWIDTGVLASSNMTVTCDWMYLSYTSSENSSAIAAAIGTGATRMVAAYAYNGQFRFAYGTNTHVGTCNANTRYKTVAVLNQGSQSFSVDGVTLYTGTNSSSISAGRNLTLFEYAGTSSFVGSVARIYSCSIIKDNALVRDFQPCIDENNNGYMFDKLAHRCYLNSGTGSFTYGKKLVTSKTVLYKDANVSEELPVGFKRVEYLQSDGNQYINTGCVLSSTDKGEALAEYTGAPTSGSSYIFGTYGGNKNFGVNTAGLTDGLSTLFYFVWANVARVDVTADPSPVALNTKYHVIISRTLMQVNDSSITYNGASFTGSNPAYLFWANGTSQPKSIMKLYYCKFWQNGTLARNFIPALDTTNTPCMYDTVTKTAYYNDGTGSFTYGNVIPNKVRLPQTTELHLLSGYTEVEYIESTGTQYIDTGFIPNQDTKVELGYKITRDLSTGFPLFGSRTSASSNGFSYQRYGSGVMGGQYGSNITYSTTPPDTNRHTVVRDKNKIYLDGTEIANQTYTTFACPGNLYINAMNNNGTAAVQNCNVAYYYMKIWDNGTLIRYFIPCLDDSGVPCLYDLVNKKTYYNAGTGQFNYGRTIQQVEYLESSGKQYINSNYKPNNNTEYEIVGTMSPSGVFGVARWSGDPQYDTFGAHSIVANALDYYGRYSDDKFLEIPDTIFDTPIIWKHTKDNISIKGIDNTIYVNQNITTTQFQSTYDLWIFGFNNMGALLSRSVGCKINRFRIWDNNTLVCNLVPAKDSNNVGFMFDRVTHSILDNVGTGSFTYGSSIKNNLRN